MSKLMRTYTVWGLECTSGFAGNLDTYLVGRYGFDRANTSAYPWLVFKTRDAARRAASGKGTRNRKAGWLVRYKPVRVKITIEAAA